MTTTIVEKDNNHYNYLFQNNREHIVAAYTTNNNLNLKEGDKAHIRATIECFDGKGVEYLDDLPIPYKMKICDIKDLIELR